MVTQNREPKISREEQLQRAKNIRYVLVSHALEGIYPTKMEKEIFELYIKGHYSLDDLKSMRP